MDQFCSAEESKFGVSKPEAIEKTRKMVLDESEELQGSTRKLRSYLNDLDAAFRVFEAQDREREAKTVE